MDFEKLLTLKDNTKPAPQKQEAVQILDDQTREAASLLLKDRLSKAALHGLDDGLVASVVAFSPGLMIYDLPVAETSLRGSQGQDSVSEDQVLYLFLLDNGLMLAEACELMGITKSLPNRWKKDNKTFALSYNAILETLADEAELMTARLATSDAKASIERMFYIKAHKTHYRDNAPPPAPVAVQLNVTIDGQELDMTQSIKNAGADPEDPPLQ